MQKLEDIKVIGITSEGLVCRICEDDEFGDTICAKCMEEKGFEKWD